MTIKRRMKKIATAAFTLAVLSSVNYQAALAEDEKEASVSESGSGQLLHEKLGLEAGNNITVHEQVEFHPIPDSARRKVFIKNNPDQDLIDELRGMKIPTYNEPEISRRPAKKRVRRSDNDKAPSDVTEVVPPPNEVYVPDTNEGGTLQDQSSEVLPPEMPGEEPVDIVDIAAMDAGYSGSIGEKVVSLVKSKLGSPYVWGATGPTTFDCSGLIQWAYNKVGVSIPRVSWGQIAAGPKVTLAEAKPGDIVGYSGGGHVAMYIGNGQVIHAPQTGDVVKISPVGMMPIESITRIAQ